MRTTVLSVALLSAVSLAACGGGASGINNLPVIHPSTAPTSAPTSAPSPGSQSAGDTRQAQIDGGTALVDANTGLALYTFDGDTVANQSACTGGCLVIWPAHAAHAGESATGNFTIFTRSDNGTLQWAYKGKPLYTFAQDTPNNNGTGEGVQGFHIARP
jgi:predicted lipoprotein with Yx(FWY)xxD motif